MYGLPHQTMEHWESTLDKVIGLASPHLSLYCLTLEEGTPMQRWVNEGKLPEPDPDLAADMYLMARDSLADAGYMHYEISNWAHPGLECMHNMAYWLNRSYLGVGPGAHSCLFGHRFWDVTSPRVYMDRVRTWAAQEMRGLDTPDWDTLVASGPVGGVEPISRELEMAETMFLGLRLLDGLSIESFMHRFGRDPLQVYGPQITELGNRAYWSTRTASCASPTRAASWPTRCSCGSSNKPCGGAGDVSS